MNICNEIILAIEKTIAEYGYGGGIRLALEMGLKESQANSISRWKDYKIKSINSDKWEKLYPLIKKYLPPDFDPKVGRLQQKLIPVTKTSDAVTEQEVILKGEKVIAGVINVHGVSVKRIRDAIKNSSLTQEQQNELILKIFG